jgi:hypothetical protein
VIRHVALFAFAPGTTAARVEAIRAELVRLPDSIPEIRDLRCGPDLGDSEGNLDFGVVADFDDVDAFHRYRDHPEHQRVLVELIRPVLASRAAVQIEVR